MSVHTWLGAHDAGVPAALSARLRGAVAPTRDDAAAIADELATAGERLLEGVLGAEVMTRAHALDVLGADALLTYAFEAAAEEPSLIGDRADVAMRRIAALAETR